VPVTIDLAEISGLTFRAAHGWQVDKKVEILSAFAGFVARAFHEIREARKPFKVHFQWH